MVVLTLYIKLSERIYLVCLMSTIMKRSQKFIQGGEYMSKIVAKLQ